MMTLTLILSIFTLTTNVYAQDASPTASPTVSPTATAAVTATATATATPTVTPTATPVATKSPTPKPTPKLTATPKSTATAEPAASSPSLTIGENATSAPTPDVVSAADRRERLPVLALIFIFGGIAMVGFTLFTVIRASHGQENLES
jgi:hypothetical protein